MTENANAFASSVNFTAYSNRQQEEPQHIITEGTTLHSRRQRIRAYPGLPLFLKERTMLLIEGGRHLWVADPRLHPLLKSRLNVRIVRCDGFGCEVLQVGSTM